MTKVSSLAVAFCVLLLFSLTAFANAVCLRGRVTDSSGVAVRDAALSISQPDIRSTRQVTTNAEGSFEICGLAPARYQITAMHHGFRSESRYQVVSDGVDTSLEIQLAPADIESRPNDSVEATAPQQQVYEFRYAPKAPKPDFVPDSPPGPRRASLHGQAYGFWGSGLGTVASVPFADQFPLSRFGGSASGDFEARRTAWFIAFDQFGMDPQRLLSSVASAQAHSAKPFQLADANVVTFSSFDARLDHRFSARDAAYARLRAGDVQSSLAIPGSSKPVNGRRLTQVNATVGNTADLSPNTVNETRAQFVSNELHLPPGASLDSVQSGLPTVHRDRVFEAANNVYHQMGGQSLRFGGDFLYQQMSISFLEATMGRVPDSSVSLSSRGGGIYIQNQHQVRPNLVLTAGAHYDIHPLKGFKTDTDNFAPQLGFAWTPAARTVIRGGGAMYYDQAPMASLPASTTSNPSYLQNAASSNLSGDAAQMTLFTLMPPVIQNSYVENANIGIEQQLGAHSFVSSTYQFARGLQLAQSGLHSVALCASAAACSAGRTLHAAEMGTGAESSYQGFTLEFRQEPVRWGNYTLAYTRSSSEGTGTLGNASYISDDLRRFSLTGTVHTSMKPAVRWRQHLSRGFLLSGVGDYSTRTEFTGMNFVDLNARLTKTLTWGQRFHLDALMETANSLQRTNAAFNRSFTRMGEQTASIFATYRAVASLQGPATAQFGLRLGF